MRGTIRLTAAQAMMRWIVAARGRDIPTVIVIDTEAAPGTGVGGHWWDVAVPEVGGPERLEKARARYDANDAWQRVFN